MNNNNNTTKTNNNSNNPNATPTLQMSQHTFIWDIYQCRHGSSVHPRLKSMPAFDIFFGPNSQRSLENFSPLISGRAHIDII